MSGLTGNDANGEGARAVDGGNPGLHPAYHCRRRCRQACQDARGNRAAAATTRRNDGIQPPRCRPPRRQRKRSCRRLRQSRSPTNTAASVTANSQDEIDAMLAELDGAPARRSQPSAARCARSDRGDGRAGDAGTASAARRHRRPWLFADPTAASDRRVQHESRACSPPQLDRSADLERDHGGGRQRLQFARAHRASGRTRARSRTW